MRSCSASPLTCSSFGWGVAIACVNKCISGSNGEHSIGVEGLDCVKYTALVNQCDASIRSMAATALLSGYAQQRLIRYCNVHAMGPASAMLQLQWRSADRPAMVRAPRECVLLMRTRWIAELDKAARRRITTMEGASQMHRARGLAAAVSSRSAKRLRHALDRELVALDVHNRHTWDLAQATLEILIASGHNVAAVLQRCEGSSTSESGIHSA